MASKLRTGIGTKISFFAFQDIITSVTGILILVTLILSLYLDQSPPVTEVERQLKERLTDGLAELTRASLANQQRETNLLILASAPMPERLQADIRELQSRLAARSNQFAEVKVDLNVREGEAAARAEKLGLAGLRERSAQLRQELERQSQANDTLIAEVAEMERQHQELEAKIESARNDQKLWLIPDATPGGKQPVLVTVTGTNLTCERFNQTTNRLQFPATDAERGLNRSLGQWNAERDYLVFYVRPSGIDLFLRCAQIARQAGFQVGYDAVEESQQLRFTMPNQP